MISMNIHSAFSMRLKLHWIKNKTECATVEIKQYHGTSFEITVFEKGAIADALHLPRSKDFKTNISPTGENENGNS